MTVLPSVFMRGEFRFGRVARIATAATTMAVAGCSADIDRFNSTSFAFNDPPETASAPPVPAAAVYSGGVDSPAVAHNAPRGPYSAGASNVDTAALPDVSPSSSLPPTSSAPSYQARPFGSASRVPAPQPQPSNDVAAAPTAGSIEVQRGDTLYALSRKHQVSVAELMKVNGLSGTNLKPGQKLVLPHGGSSAPVVAAAEPEPAPMAPASDEVAARYKGTYTVKAGDSLYNIARSHNVNFAELQQVNGISNPRRVKPGTVLKVPGIAPVAAADSIAAPVAPVPAATAEPEVRRIGEATTSQPTVINRETKVAELSDRKSDVPVAPVAEAAPAAKGDKVAVAVPQAEQQASDSVKLRWPAQGRVISGFGPRPDGTHNDGINLSVPLGTDVHAAEGGVVAYAGSELKGYGNLVLLRHDNGWVTAYAHNDELLVQRGDKVKRGQVIGKAGKTGSVDQPQVHFEVRQGSKPVDPTPYMEKL